MLGIGSIGRKADLPMGNVMVYQLERKNKSNIPDAILK
jgi:hypothetical protein